MTQCLVVLLFFFFLLIYFYLTVTLAFFPSPQNEHRLVAKAKRSDVMITATSVFLSKVGSPRHLNLSPESFRWISLKTLESTFVGVTLLQSLTVTIVVLARGFGKPWAAHGGKNAACQVSSVICVEQKLWNAPLMGRKCRRYQTVLVVVYLCHVMKYFRGKYIWNMTLKGMNKD